MDAKSYALSKQYTNLVAIGLSSATVDDVNKSITFTLASDGSQHTIHFSQPADGHDGISVTGVSDKGNGVFTLLFSDGSESDPIQTVKGQKGDKLTFNDLTDEEKASLKGDSGVSPTITENADNTDKIYRLDITTADSTFTTPNLRGKDGEGSEGGEANVIDSISVNGVNVVPDENKNVDITVPSIEGLTKDADLATVAKSGSYEDLSNKPTIPSLDGYAKTSEIPSKVSELENDSNYLSSIPEEYVTETELSAKGYLTEHQDISGKVDKVEGKSLISDAEIARLASVDNYDDTDIRTELANKADAIAIPSKVSVLENDSKYQTESDVTTTLTDYATKTYVGEQITNAEHLKREIVTVLPSDTEASDNIIYMLKVESATGNDKYQEYMKIDGTVQMVGDTSVDLTDYAKSVDIPTTVAELTDSADYAKKTDLHSHTNKTVLDGITSTKVSNWDSAKTHADSAHAPSNAQANVIESVKVNGSALSVSDKAVNIDLSGYAVNEDLDTLEYSEVAGGKNLIDVKKVILGDMMEGKVASGNNYITDFIHLEYGKKYILSNCYKQAYETAWFTQDKKFVQRTFGTELTPPTNDCYYVRIEYGVNEGINAQLEEGTTSTPYEPYIPSVKMLATENAQQNTEAMDLKMLGWTVPRECPIQNYTDSNGVFHQRVDRVDLGSLKWELSSATNLFFTGSLTGKHKFPSTDDVKSNIYTNKYITVARNTILSSNKSISSSTSGFVQVIDSSYTDATTFKNAMQGVYLYYELATEKTISVDGNEAVTKVNESLDVIGKCKNLLNPTLETTTLNGVTCTNNGDGTYTLNGTASNVTVFIIETNLTVKTIDKFKIVGCPSGGGDKYKLDLSGKKLIDYEDYGNGGTGYVTSDDNGVGCRIVIYSGTTCDNLVFKPMLTTDLNATYDDYVPYTGDGDTLTHDVAELKNDLSVKKFELVAGVLWLCVCGKHCVLTLNGYNLTEPTHFDKLEEYQPYLVARNVVSKGDGVCIAAVEPNGNINASDLVVGTSLTGQLFGEISWIANI